jgi:hypothetical protein
VEQEPLLIPEEEEEEMEYLRVRLGYIFLDIKEM